MIDLKKATSVAVDLAKKSGKLLMKNYGKAKVVKIKEKLDICSDMDLAVEKIIINGIKKNYPDHHIISEEAGDNKKISDYKWVIDPIDGTKHYVMSVPIFSVCIALEYKGELVLGVVYNPCTNHLYHAYKNGGAYLNNKKIHVSEIYKLDYGFVYLDISKVDHLSKKEVHNALARINKLIKKAYRVRAFGCGSLAMCYLAQGAYDVYFDLTGSTKYVDIAAGSVIIKEAGGYVKYLEGTKDKKKIKHLLAVNSRLRSKVQHLLKNI